MLAHLAAWDVHRAKIHGRCELSSGIEPFERLVEQVMTTRPYAFAETSAQSSRWENERRSRRKGLSRDPPW